MDKGLNLVQFYKQTWIVNKTNKQRSQTLQYGDCCGELSALVLRLLPVSDLGPVRLVQVSTLQTVQTSYAAWSSMQDCVFHFNFSILSKAYLSLLPFHILMAEKESIHPHMLPWNSQMGMFICLSLLGLLCIVEAWQNSWIKNWRLSL